MHLPILKSDHDRACDTCRHAHFSHYGGYHEPPGVDFDCAYDDIRSDPTGGFMWAGMDFRWGAILAMLWDNGFEGHQCPAYDPHPMCADHPGHRTLGDGLCELCYADIDRWEQAALEEEHRAFAAWERGE